MQLLLESQEREGARLGAVVSFVLHAGLLGLVLLAYSQGPPRPSLADQFVTYLVPPDRKGGERAAPNAGAWSGAAGPRVQGEGIAAPPPVRGSGEHVLAQGDSTAVPPPPDISQLLGDSVLTELEVDSVVQRYSESAAPDYPRSLLAKNIEGSAFVLYVVDSTGHADTASFRVIRASHPEFAEAVREALPKMRFRPAFLSGIPVPQLVQQSFAFRIRRDSLPPPRKPEVR